MHFAKSWEVAALPGSVTACEALHLHAFGFAPCAVRAEQALHHALVPWSFTAGCEPLLSTCALHRIERLHDDFLSPDGAAELFEAADQLLIFAMKARCLPAVLEPCL